jgi:hypothetical protein
MIVHFTIGALPHVSALTVVVPALRTQKNPVRDRACVGQV